MKKTTPNPPSGEAARSVLGKLPLYGLFFVLALSLYLNLYQLFERNAVVINEMEHLTPRRVSVDRFNSVVRSLSGCEQENAHKDSLITRLTHPEPGQPAPLGRKAVSQVQAAPAPVKFILF